MSELEEKIAAAAAALAEVRAGMRLGLGTGTTSEEFVKLLAQAEFARTVRCTCTSERTEALARSLGIATEPLSAVAPLDLAVDGADEIDRDLRLVKGRGGALLREKIVEQQAARFIVIADESKLVERLGVGPVPVEVTVFAVEVLLARFAKMGLRPSLRMIDAVPRSTDEGNEIIDIRIPEREEIADVIRRVRDHAGVVETGFFPTEATEAMIATREGVRRMTRGTQATSS